MEKQNNREIYLDNSATTALCEKAKEKISEAVENYGNPSSLHALGNKARALVEESRESVYAALGIRTLPSPTHRVIFTSCGTEANNLALSGVIGAKKFRFLPRIITTDSEHPSVLSLLNYLEASGRAAIIRLRTVNGVVSKDELLDAVNDHTVLVSIMLVNNETGAVYDIKNLFAAVKEKKHDVITHSDMTQGFLKIGSAGGYTSLGADMITISGHKIHGAKGVGALAVRQEIIKREALIPVLYGGGQEGALRSGTENVAGIASMGAACDFCSARLKDGFEDRMRELRLLFAATLAENASADIKINTPEHNAPHIISVTLPGIKSQTMLSALSAKGIYVSSGSACSSHGGHKSYVLTAYGLTPGQADCTIRVSMSAFTTEDEVTSAAREISEACGHLISVNG